MKNLNEVTSQNPQYKAMINAVIKNIGIDRVEDVINNGIDGGFNGFIYHSDTHDFTKKHRAAIVKMLEELADDMGEDVVNIVSGFGVFRGNPMDAQDKKDLYTILSGRTPQQGTITNVLAWFAAEEVCRMFEN